MVSKSFQGLRRRAKRLLNADFYANKTVVADLLHELSLHHLELEIQTENLLDTESNLKVLLDKYHVLFELAPVGYFILDDRGLILEANKSASDLIGIATPLLKNQCFLLHVDHDERHLFVRMRQQLKSTEEKQSCELHLLRKDKPKIRVILQIRQELCTDKLIFVCVTPLQMPALGLNDSEAHASGQGENYQGISLDNAMVHEINHPLTSISNFINGCINRIECGDYEIDEILRIMKLTKQQSYRAAQIVTRMKHFSAQRCLQLETFNLDIVIQDTLAMLPFELNENKIKIDYKKSPNLPTIYADKIQLQNLFLNIIRNAIEAMRDAKVVNPVLKIYLQSNGKDKLEIAFIDNGPGISDANMQQLFSAYFTTKAYGLGLGLIISKGIVEAHHGTMEIGNNANGGGRVIITLPASHNIRSLRKPKQQVQS